MNSPSEAALTGHSLLMWCVRSSMHASGGGGGLLGGRLRGLRGLEHGAEHVADEGALGGEDAGRGLEATVHGVLGVDDVDLADDLLRLGHVVAEGVEALADVLQGHVLNG